MPVHSVHTFMLPMRWDFLPASFRPSSKRKGDISFDKRTDLQEFVDLLTPRTTESNNKWERIFYRIDEKAANYNELVYYHSHASTNFFDLQHEEEPDQFKVHKNKVSLYFELKNVNPDSDFYKIYVNKGPGGIPKNYTLKLSGISLHVYTTGVCLLTYTLKNDSFPDAEDILFINEFGRRIYPPFIGEAGKLDTTKDKVLANKIEIKVAAFDINPFAEDFTRYTNFKANNIETHKSANKKYNYNAVIDFPKTVRHLFAANHFAFSAGEEEKSECAIISFRLLTSDRMFFQCWYGNNTIASNLSKALIHYDRSEGYMFAQCKFWYAFMYGDRATGNLGVGNRYFMEKQLLDNTYTRWAEYGTLYGFTNDSFVCISQDLKTLKDNCVPDLAVHMQTIYYTMAVLNLVQRASALRFSGEVATLADLGKADGDDIFKRIQHLNLNYIEFINKVYYREISPEIQGIEIYNHLQKAMNIVADVNDLKDEVNELHNFSMMKKQDEQSRKSNKLNLIATIFLPASFVASILGIGFIDSNSKFIWFASPTPIVGKILILLGIVIILSVLTLYAGSIIRWFKKLIKN
jgi:hypothetical protein